MGAEKYGYGDAAPDTENTKSSFPKRLSTRNSIRRRRSICRQKRLSFSEDPNGDDRNLPFHPERAPRRRSSIKGTCPTRARAAARRRASIAPCTANSTSSSFEEELANRIPQSSQVFKIRLPKRRDSIQRRTSITFNDKDINNVRKIEAISQVKEGAVVKQELGCQDIEYTQQIKKKIRALIDKIDAASGHYYNGTEYGTRGLEEETSTIQYDHDDDNDNHDDDNQKLYYSVYDDDDDIIMGEDDDNEYYKYEAANEDFYEEDEDDT